MKSTKQEKEAMKQELPKRKKKKVLIIMINMNEEKIREKK